MKARNIEIEVTKGEILEGMEGVMLERDKLKDRNAELLAALEGVVQYSLNYGDGQTTEGCMAASKAAELAIREAKDGA